MRKKVVKESILKLEIGESKTTFNLEKAVCNHGFFMMSPNQWIPSTKTLQRPLRLSDSTSSVFVSISHSSFVHHDHSDSLHIKVHHTKHCLSPADKKSILEQVSRMLRITDEDENNVKEFQKLNPKAKEMGFGRIFRSPTLFEDAVKCFLLCNCSWSRTLGMAKELCKLQAEIVRTTTANKERGLKRKTSQNNFPLKEDHDGLLKNYNNGDDDEIIGNFPNSKELSQVSVKSLKKCSVGYRAKYIIKFAKDVEEGKIKLEKVKDEDIFMRQQLQKKLICIKGFGQFSSATLLMCIGFYQQVPVDTETLRHLKQVHGRDLCKEKNLKEEVEKIYDKFAPFQCLAYWLELIDFYENKFGKLSELSSDLYHKISGRLHF